MLLACSGALVRFNPGPPRAFQGSIFAMARLGSIVAFVMVALSFLGGASLAQTKLIKHGSDDEAAAYYARISAELNLQVEQSTLSDVVDYLGYRGLSAGDLEAFEPTAFAPSTSEEFARLQAMAEHPDEFAAQFALEDFADTPILAARYLAPRIADVSGAPPYRVGWRKLVRVRSRSGSAADTAGITSAYILFDYVRAQDDPAPFPRPGDTDDRAAAIVQLLLVARPDHPALTDSLYFMLFYGKPADYASTRYVSSNFDLPPEPSSDGKFYVPTACGRCHGDVGRPEGGNIVFRFAKLNFLDTDYWHDRIGAGDFFAEAGSRHGVLFDGSVDPSSAQYAAAFDVVRTLNREIAEQNERSPTEPRSPNYQLQGARKWLELHADDIGHAPPLERSLGREDESWSGNHPADGPLLALLSRHCYRCHNTIDFNVFLKPRFAGVAKSAISSIMFGIMPFGHDLRTHEPDEAEALLKGLEQLLAQ